MKLRKTETMKRPYLTQFERILITHGTLIGDCVMLRFRFIQLGRSIEVFMQYIIYNLKEMKTRNTVIAILKIMFLLLVGTLLFFAIPSCRSSKMIKSPHGPVHRYQLREIDRVHRYNE
ncbi:hypothetical protein LCGC14_2603310 [marine sediment metagenome]|uniref:Uncharacterized protein n=1 Tax=marine sediment metagenome TaxID=412755 RepID=A0A0F9CJ52_9ZZZZ